MNPNMHHYMEYGLTAGTVPQVFDGDIWSNPMKLEGDFIELDRIK